MDWDISAAIVCGGSSPEADVSRRSARNIHRGLCELIKSVEIFEFDENLPSKLLDFKPTVVFPAVHGCPGEDGALSALCELLKLPYVGSSMESIWKFRQTA